MKAHHTYTQVGVSCPPQADEMLNPSPVLLMKFSANNHCLRVAANHYTAAFIRQFRGMTYSD